MLCAGDFIGSGDVQLEQYISGAKKAPLATFFLAGKGPTPERLAGSPDGLELCENLTYLGEAGKREIAGITVTCEECMNIIRAALHALSLITQAKLCRASRGVEGDVPLG